MEYQIKSRGIIPVLRDRNPYRYIVSEVQRSILSGTRKKKKRGQRGGILPLTTAAMSGLMALRRRFRGRRRRQKGGQFTFFTPSLVAAAKTLRTRSRRKQRGGNIFAGAAKIGLGLGQQKDYRRFSLSGFSDPGYRRIPTPWEK